MSQSLTQIITDGATEINVLRPGQPIAAEILPLGLRFANELLDAWAMERFFIYQGTSPTWTILPSFPDVTTAYNYAPGNLLALRKNITLALVPSLKQYYKVPEPMIDQVTKEAEESVKFLQGVGPQ